MASDPSSLAALQQRLGLVFHQAGLLQEALTHSSFANECDDVDVRHNQRLEFLGDALIDLVVGRWLFERLPEASEGELTSLRARIVRTEGLASLAQELELGRYMRFGHGEEVSGGQDKAANLCAAFEALAGAIYLDQGMAVTERWFIQALERQAAAIEGARAAKDAKSTLQELVQGTLRLTPHYELIDATGPDHARTFTIEVQVDGLAWGTGSGSNKQLAEQAAAREALASHGPRTNE